MSITHSKRTRGQNEAGQVMLFTLLGLSLFLIGAMAFAIDLSNMWFTRQNAQTAADAACTAGAMDMLVEATNGALPAGANFTTGTAFDCNSTTTASPCAYAATNGFPSSISQASANSGTLGDNVYVDFPSATGSLANLNLPPTSVIGKSLIRVRVTRNSSTWFSGMLRGLNRQSTGSSAICAIEEATSPIPILVLNPSVASSFDTQGNPTIAIVGGPNKSIQVNSCSTSGGSGTCGTANAAHIQGSAVVNLCAAGPTYCGSSMGIWGSETVQGGFYSSASTCSSNRPALSPACSASQLAPQWNSPSAPVADPFATISAPSQPTHHTWTGPYRTGSGNGCPVASCDEYAPGYYPNGIMVKNATAIFDPGLYWLQSQQCNNSGAKGSLCEDSNSCIRPSTLAGDGSGGTIFYFADTNSVGVAANGGGCTGAAAFNTANGALGLGVQCTGTSSVPPNLPTLLTGSVLLAPCQAPVAANGYCAPNCSLNFGDPQGISDPLGEQRGILFFQKRSVNATSNPSWSGGGSMLLAGSMYFHECVASGTDTGQGCSTSAFNDQLQMGGNTGSSTYVLGDIIADQLYLHGTPNIIMDLNPTAAYTTLKASLVQ